MEIRRINDEKLIPLKDLQEYFDEEIDYLENHVKTANEGIAVNVKMIESWVFEVKRIKKEILGSNS
jgi:hypothetical protein